jgi:hypothetical protein
MQTRPAHKEAFVPLAAGLLFLALKVNTVLKEVHLPSHAQLARTAKTVAPHPLSALLVHIALQAAQAQPHVCTGISVLWVVVSPCHVPMVLFPPTME